MSKRKEWIRDSQLAYKHGLGQNFLYDDDLLEALATASGITDQDDVLEIGPGAGTLTKHLAQHAHFVRALELDERLIPLLKAYMEPYANVDIVQGDALTADLSALTSDMHRPFSVVANIPYYITSPLIMRLVSGEWPIQRIALMVQKEVAEKILSHPGEDGWGMLALTCQYAYDGRMAMEVPARCFTPVPKVDSAFIILEKKDTPAVSPRSEADFFRVAQAAFALRRKTMTNGLCAALHLEREAAAVLMEQAGLDIKVRGETLQMDELRRLSDAWTAQKTEV